MEEAGASFTEKDKQFLYKTQILFTASKSLALLAVDATPRPCNVSVQLMLSHPCDTLFISLFTNAFYEVPHLKVSAKPGVVPHWK